MQTEDNKMKTATINMCQPRVATGQTGDHQCQVWLWDLKYGTEGFVRGGMFKNEYVDWEIATALCKTTPIWDHVNGRLKNVVVRWRESKPTYLITVYLPEIMAGDKNDIRLDILGAAIRHAKEHLGAVGNE
jgi:hypothetical protein